ncbi:restriction endonuclease subunit S [Xanthomonas dyei]|uniref:restriction endonuclease subunit S n=1 Tax=Xanthomonas dyei TaxID=743699 RepID=UPI0032E909FB
MIFCSGKQEHRLKWAFESCKNGAWGSEPDGEADVICIRAADFDGQSGRLNEGERTLRAIDPAVFEKIALRPGDLVMEKSGGGEKQLVGRTALFDDDRPSVTSNFLARCRPASGIDPAYLNYLMLAIYTGRGTYPHIKQSTGIQNLDLGRYLDMRVSIPELLAQQRIARFLDDKTARIDALIEKKQALQERLAEKRQALITRAVTKGLNPDVPMKPSGVDWLGDIPSHWDLLQLRRVTRKVTTGRTPPSALADYFTDGDVNWFTPGDFGDGIELCDSERKISSTAIDDGVASLYPSGTVFLGNL